MDISYIELDVVNLSDSEIDADSVKYVGLSCIDVDGVDLSNSKVDVNLLATDIDVGVLYSVCAVDLSDFETDVYISVFVEVDLAFENLSYSEVDVCDFPYSALLVDVCNCLSSRSGFSVDVLADVVFVEHFP